MKRPVAFALLPHARNLEGDFEKVKTVVDEQKLSQLDRKQQFSVAVTAVEQIQGIYQYTGHMNPQMGRYAEAIHASVTICKRYLNGEEFDVAAWNHVRDGVAAAAKVHCTDCSLYVALAARDALYAAQAYMEGGDLMQFVISVLTKAIRANPELVSDLDSLLCK